MVRTTSCRSGKKEGGHREGQREVGGEGTGVQREVGGEGIGGAGGGGQQAAMVLGQKGQVSLSFTLNHSLGHSNVTSWVTLM